MADEMDWEFANDMFKRIKAFEQKNVRTGQHDDKYMAQQIEKFIFEQVSKKEKEKN